jgi:hypothetical protein
MSSLARVIMTGLEVTDLLLALGRQTGAGDRLLKLAQQREPRLRTAGVVAVNVGTIAGARDRALAGPSGVAVARSETPPAHVEPTASGLRREGTTPGLAVSPPPSRVAFEREASAAVESPAPVTATDATGEPLVDVGSAIEEPDDEPPPSPPLVAVEYRTTEGMPFEGPTTPAETPESRRRRPPTG